MGGISSIYGNCCLYHPETPSPLVRKPDTIPTSLFASMHQDVILSPSRKPRSMPLVQISRLLLDARMRFIDYLSEDFTKGYEEITRQYGCRVYAKDTCEGVVIKADWLTCLTGEEFISYFQDLHKRKAWDKTIEDIYNIGSDDDFMYEYTRFKKKFAIAQRDMLVATKVFRSNGIHLVSVSTQHSTVPLNDGIVRIDVKLAGYHTLSIAKDSLGNITRVFSILEADFGGSVPKSIIKKIISHTFPNIVYRIDQQINDHK